jgi:hypothetical protein
MNNLLARVRARKNETLRKSRNERAKRALRKSKKSRVSKSRKSQVPKPSSVVINGNYVNPISLSSIPVNVVVYEVVNRGTKRKNYYERKNLWPLLPKSIKNNYNLMLAFPKTPLFRNPYTRGNVYPRNIRRVVMRSK